MCVYIYEKTPPISIKWGMPILNASNSEKKNTMKM